MTPTELETFVRQRYNAVGDTFFPQAEIMNFFYAAQMELASETFCIQATYTTTSVDGQRAYDYPTTALSISRVEYNGQRIYPNDFIDDDSETGNQPGTTSEGTPVHYQIWNNQLFLRPTPDTSALTIRVFSYDIPTQPTAASTLDVPGRYHLMLADYALFCMFAQDKNYTLANYHKNIWEGHKKNALRIEAMRVRGDESGVVKDIEYIYTDPSNW